MVLGSQKDQIDARTLEPKELATLQSYNTMADEWSKASDGVDLQGNYLWGQDMETFRRLAQGAPSSYGGQYLLEVGTGTGRDAVLLSPHYNYLGTDASSAFLEIARGKNSELSRNAFRLVNVYSLKEDFSPENFDLFWVCATLLHCPKHRMLEALTSLRAVLKKGAIGFVSLKEGDGEETYRWNNRDDLNRYFYDWQDPEFRILLDQSGFEVVEFYKKPSRKNFLCYSLRAV